MSDDSRPLPVPDPGTVPYWQAARAHRLVLPRCEACGEVHFYPRSLCPHCGCARLAWIEVSGRGTVFSYTVVHRPPSPAFKPLVPYVVAVIALVEGPHLMSRLVGCRPEEARIDLPVEVVWEDLTDEIALPCFRPC